MIESNQPFHSGLTGRPSLRICSFTLRGALSGRLSHVRRSSAWSWGRRRRYAHDAELRARIRRQLNRGESRHALARRLFFANQGTFRVGDRDEIMNKVTALSVLSNAVLVWNSVRFAEVVAGLEATTGEVVAAADLARVSPLASAHVIPSGTNRFPKAARPLE